MFNPSKNMTTEHKNQFTYHIMFNPNNYMEIEHENQSELSPFKIK